MKTFSEISQTLSLKPLVVGLVGEKIKIERVDSYRMEAWDIILKCPQHTFQILTKRPERIFMNLPGYWSEIKSRVWLGTSIGSQKGIDRLYAGTEMEFQIKITSIEVILIYGKDVNSTIMAIVKFYERGNGSYISEFEFGSFDGKVLKGPLFATCLPMTEPANRDEGYFYKAPANSRRGSIRFEKKKGISEFIITDDWDFEHVLEVSNRNYKLIESIKKQIRSGGFPYTF